MEKTFFQKTGIPYEVKFAELQKPGIVPLGVRNSVYP